MLTALPLTSDDLYIKCIALLEHVFIFLYDGFFSLCCILRKGGGNKFYSFDKVL